MSETKRPHIVWRVLHGLENGSLVALLSVMILLAVWQIVLRNLAGLRIEWAQGLVGKFIWIDPFLRYGVLWVGLLGAMVASRDYNHITIDVVSYFLKKRVKAGVKVAVDLFTALVAGLLTHAAVNFIADEMAGGAMAFAKVPTWIAELILPVAFGTIALRYLIFAGLHIHEALTGKDEPQEAAS